MMDMAGNQEAKKKADEAVKALMDFMTTGNPTARKKVEGILAQFTKNGEFDSNFKTEYRKAVNDAENSEATGHIITAYKALIYPEKKPEERTLKTFSFMDLVEHTYAAVNSRDSAALEKLKTEYGSAMFEQVITPIISLARQQTAPKIDVMKNITDPDRKNAATKNIQNRKDAEEYLAKNQKRATIALFNELCSTPAFLTYLKSRNQEKGYAFGSLYSYVSSHGNKLDDKADATVLDAASTFVRYFLVNYGALGRFDGAKIFKNEITQLGAFKDIDRMGNEQMKGPLGSDTIAAGLLFLRRAKEPNAGLWTAPKETEITAKPEPKTMPASPLQQLQKFYDENWKTLTQDLYNAAKEGDPAKIIELSRKLPEGYGSLEKAFEKLNYDDIKDAFVNAFKETMVKNEDFKKFMKAGKVTIKPLSGTGDPYLPNYIKRVQEFINEQAFRDPKLGRDIAKLNKSFGLPEAEKLKVDPSNQMLTLAAISLYQWRKANKDEMPGKWGKDIGVPVDVPAVEIKGFN